MASEICFEVNGEKTCIPLFFHSLEELRRGPDPDPWVKDALVISGIHEVIQGLSGNYRSSLEQAVRNAASELQTQMPSGLTLNLRAARAQHSSD